MEIDEYDLTTTYTTPSIVAETLDLPDPGNNLGMFRFSDVSHPTVFQVARMIRANEDIIDRRINATYRVKRVKDKVMTINEYWHDINGWRGEYHNQGGHFIQLRRNVLPWDPEQGDKLELRSLNNTWSDVSNWPLGEMDDDGNRGHVSTCWFDYPAGKLYLKTRPYQVKANSVRISYRYGSDEEPPDGICRICSLMTAINVLNMQTFNIKVGMGGDISGIKESQIKNWLDEVNNFFTTYQQTGAVRSIP